MYYRPEPLKGRVALVFPGIGSQFAGMGRDLSARWPEVFRALDAETLRLKSQLAPGARWDAWVVEEFEDQRAPIMGQVEDANGELITVVAQEPGETRRSPQALYAEHAGRRGHRAGDEYGILLVPNRHRGSTEWNRILRVEDGAAYLSVPGRGRRSSGAYSTLRERDLR